MLGGQQPFAQGSECVCVRPDLLPGATTLHGVARSRVRPAEAMRVLDLSWVKSGASFVGSAYLRGFSLPGFCSRTPGPPPFSSMNSTPAASRARRIAKSFAAVIEVAVSVNSARRTVATLNEVCRARSSALHRMSERAALICALVSGFELILTCFSAYAMFHIISYLYYHNR
jgi:hypothetical protein